MKNINTYIYRMGGIEPDLQRNRTAIGGCDISADDSKARIYVVDTNEEIIVARKAQALLEATI